MKTPDRYTTETGKKPHSQIAHYLARPTLKSGVAHHRKHHRSPLIRKK